ncbi:MAG: hypothetical protein NXH82_03945 [Rhodobacteraceae bacterium]|nr:hypothetical protein [Paracoccaceae bacterium]
MVYAVPILAVCLATGVAYWLVLRRRWWIAGVMLAGLAVAMVATVLAGRAQQGWDGIAYAVVLVLVLAPLAGGLLLGSVIGLVARLRGRHE